MWKHPPNYFWWQGDCVCLFFLSHATEVIFFFPLSFLFSLSLVHSAQHWNSQPRATATDLVSVMFHTWKELKLCLCIILPIQNSIVTVMFQSAKQSKIHCRLPSVLVVISGSHWRLVARDSCKGCVTIRKMSILKWSAKVVGNEDCTSGLLHDPHYNSHHLAQLHYII